MPMGCNCCTERPCCGNRLFRGPGSVDPLTLSLESRQTWAAVGTATTCPALYPYGNNPTGTDPTRILTSHDLTMTYEQPIPAALLDVVYGQQWYETLPTVYQDALGFCRFQNEYVATATQGIFFDPTEGWYVSDSVELYQVPGDAVWTGELMGNLSGRYFMARAYKPAYPVGECESSKVFQKFAFCVFGFLFDSPIPSGSALPFAGYGVRAVEFLAIINGIGGSSGAVTEYLYHSDGNVTNRGWGEMYLPDASVTGGVLFGKYPDVSVDVGFSGLYPMGTTDCSPIFGEQNGPSLSYGGCAISGAFHPTGLASKAGLYASPFRNLSMTVGLGGRGDLPTVDDTPPASIAALTSTHIVSEIFHMHYTISE